MCGLCNEYSGIEILDAGGDLSGYPGFPLMEGDDLLDELRNLRRSDTPLADHENALVLCRLLELLAENGFAAPVCRQLLDEPLVVKAIEEQCAGGKRERLKGMDFPAHKDKSALLYEPATYLTAQGWARLRSEEGSLGAAGEEGLAWFVVRFVVPRRTELEEHDEQEHDELSDELNDNLWLLARLIMAGIAAKGVEPRRRMLLEWLPLCVPRYGSKTFIGLDLWLQRRAFLHHARRHPVWVKGYRFPARPMLYAYFAVKTRMSMARRRALATEIEEELRQRGQLYAEDMDAITLLRRWDEQAFFSFPDFKEEP
jgi:hypothetical protein